MFNFAETRIDLDRIVSYRPLPMRMAKGPLGLTAFQDVVFQLVTEPPSQLRVTLPATSMAEWLKKLDEAIAKK
jgi:hypothetical protein